MARHITHTTVGPHYEFGQKIAAARRRAGLSQERLADRVGLTRRYVISIENGSHVPRPERMAAINEALGTSIEASSYRRARTYWQKPGEVSAHAAARTEILKSVAA